MTARPAPDPRASVPPRVLLFGGAWLPIRDGDPRLIALYERHYSCNPRTTHEAHLRSGVSGVGESVCLMDWRCEAGFIWVRNTTPRMDGQIGPQCSFFRNEGDLRSSVLIREADELAWSKWPDEPRHWTYVDSRKIKSSNPGYCFLMAGWRRCGVSKGGLTILEVLR